MSASTKTLSAKHREPSAQRPWYREPMLWLVIGIPLATVVAGITTVVIAYSGKFDPGLDLPRLPKGPPITSSVDQPVVAPIVEPVVDQQAQELR